MTYLTARARQFATAAHEAVGQLRLWTNEPYIVHPAAVAAIVETVPHTPEMVAAAWLHDTVEDTRVTLDDVRAVFGNEVAKLVWWLTDASRSSDGNRATRKAIDRAHLAKAPPHAQTIKLADIIDNGATIEARDPGFAKVWREEKRLLLAVMDKGDPTLMKKALEDFDGTRTQTCTAGLRLAGRQDVGGI
jgi:(p)ppGpp synthase/HD superfamily hydrolase